MVSVLPESVRQLFMITHPDPGVISGIVHFYRLALVAQVDRPFVADVINLATVSHDFHIVQVSNHVQRSFVRFDQYPVLISDDMQVVLIGIDPDALLVSEHILRFPNWYDHFWLNSSNSDFASRCDLIRASIANDYPAKSDGQHISRGGMTARVKHFLSFVQARFQYQPPPVVSRAVIYPSNGWFVGAFHTRERLGLVAYIHDNDDDA